MTRAAPAFAALRATLRQAPASAKALPAVALAKAGGTPSEIRTRTGHGLSVLPLPLGYRRNMGLPAGFEPAAPTYQVGALPTELREQRESLIEKSLIAIGDQVILWPTFVRRLATRQRLQLRA